MTACGAASTGGASGGQGPLSGTTITIYNAQHEQTTKALTDRFTALTGIKVRVKDNNEDVLTAQIQQEGSHSPADVFYTENSNWLQQLDDHGLLAHIDAKTLAQVPAADSATDGNWLGVSARVSALVYDPSKVPAAELPTSVLQLADPKWKGRLELAPAETDFWPIVSSIARSKGTTAALAWLRGIQSNAASNANVPDNETVTTDVDNGTADMGLINHYYYYRLRSEAGAANFHAQIAFFTPRDPGYVEDISAAGVLASSAHQAAAQEFVAFLVSRAGQEILAHSDSFEYPIRAGVAASPEMTPLKQLKPTDFTPADLGTGINAKTLMQQVGLL